MKQKTVYICTNCNSEYPKWMGKCASCGEWNTLEEKQILQSEIKASKQLVPVQGNLIKLGEVSSDQMSRQSTGLSELDLVLGGGLIPGQVVLFSGEPGVGKSTLLLQVLVSLHSKGVVTLYASGEESAGQVSSRARRLFKPIEYEGIKFVSAAGVHGVLAQVEALRPAAVVVDSIQTMFDEGVSSLPGSLAQVKACTAALVSAAKQQGFTLVIVGHINKDGAIAGPKVLEHLVDTVLQMEGDHSGEYRLLRALKNRFGSTGEVGLFSMTQSGMRDMNFVDSAIAGGAEPAVGAAKTAVLEGNRLFIVEVQGLSQPTVFAYPKRVAEGLSVARLQLIAAILDKFAGTRLGSQDVYLRTAGGYKLEHPVTDLAVAAAIISSENNITLSPGVAFLGELALSGRVFLSSSVASRLNSLPKQGISKVYLPRGKYTKVKGLEMVEVSSLSQLSSLIK